jgi:hypothetical protein
LLQQRDYLTALRLSHKIIKSAEGIDVDAVSAIVSKGTDVPADLKAIADVQSFFTLFKNSFIPTVEAAYKDVEADVK